MHIKRFFNDRTAFATFATCQVNNSGILPQIAPRRPRSHKVSTLLVNGLGMNDVTLESIDEFHISCGNTCLRAMTYLHGHPAVHGIENQRPTLFRARAEMEGKSEIRRCRGCNKVKQGVTCPASLMSGSTARL